MKIKLFFIMFFLSATVCFGQSAKEERKLGLKKWFSTWEGLGYNPIKTKSVDSVYSFLGQVDFIKIIPYSKKRIAIVEKPMSDEYFNNKGFGSFIRDMSGHYPIFGEKAAAEIFYGMTDSVVFDKPLDYFSVARINREYIGVADIKAYNKFIFLYANDSLREEANKNLSMNYSKSKKEQKIFVHGMETAQRRLSEDAGVIEISIPYFDSSYENAVLVLFTNDYIDSLFYLMFKRDDKGNWQFEGCHSSKWGFSTEIGHIPANAKKFYK